MFEKNSPSNPTIIHFLKQNNLFVQNKLLILLIFLKTCVPTIISAILTLTSHGNHPNY